MDVLHEFQNPPMSARPMVRWWWTGADVQSDELLREVAEMDAAGLLGAEVQAFMVGAPPNLAQLDPERYARSHRYLHADYYELLREVLEEGARRGMTFDVTAGSAWPAGGTHVTTENSLQTLLMGVTTLRGPTHYREPAPRFKRPLFHALAFRLPPLHGRVSFDSHQMRLVRCLAARPLHRAGTISAYRPQAALLDPESLTDISSCLDSEGRLDWQAPPGAWQIFAIYAGPSGARPIYDAREDVEGASLVLDHLASGPILEHLEHHLSRAKEHFGEHFGATLRSFFTNSLELNAEWLWTPHFLDEFRRRRGYDVTPYLPLAYMPAHSNRHLASVIGNTLPCFDLPGQLGQRIRYDWELTQSDLFTEHFAQAMTNYAEAHGLLNRMQAYGMRADTLKCYRIAHIPETEQRYAGGVMDFLRLAGSAALIFDKPLVTGEALGWNQRDYLTTPLKWKVAADRLFAAGANQLIYFGYPYQHTAYPYPGYHPFSSPHLPAAARSSSHLGRSDPFWRYYPALNGYVTRCQFLLRQGTTQANVGVFYPLLNYPAAALRSEELVGGCLDELDVPLGRHAGGPVKRKLDDEEQWVLAQMQLGDDLQAHGYGYVHLNAESLLSARVEDGILLIGAARLQAVILNQVEAVEIGVAHKLADIAAAGVPIVFGGSLPVRQPGFLYHRENDARVSALLASVAGQGAYLVESGRSVARFLRETLSLRPNIVFEQPQPAVHSLCKQMDDTTVYFLRNATRQPLTLAARFPQFGRVPHLLDPWTGEVVIAAQFETLGDEIRMELAFPPYGSCLLAFSSPASPAHAPVADRPAVVVEQADAPAAGASLDGQSRMPAAQIGADNAAGGSQSAEEVAAPVRAEVGPDQAGVAPMVHVTQGDLPVARHAGGIWALAEHKGSFRFTLGDGRQLVAEVGRNPPPILQLTDWRLETAVRDLRGTLKPVTLEPAQLRDWREIRELRYGSEPGIYELELNLDDAYLQPGLGLTLDLGRVHDAAEIEINGQSLLPLLVYPFAADVTGYLGAGPNVIRVTVIPTLRNGLIGLAATGAEQWKQFRSCREFAPSGLLGPVRLLPAWRLLIARAPAR